MVSGNFRRLLPLADPLRLVTSGALWTTSCTEGPPGMKSQKWMMTKAAEVEGLAARARAGERGAKTEMELLRDKCGHFGVSGYVAGLGEGWARMVQFDFYGTPIGPFHLKYNVVKCLVKQFTGGRIYYSDEATTKARACIHEGSGARLSACPRPPQTLSALSTPSPPHANCRATLCPPVTSQCAARCFCNFFTRRTQVLTAADLKEVSALGSHLHVALEMSAVAPKLLKKKLEKGDSRTGASNVKGKTHDHSEFFNLWLISLIRGRLPEWCDVNDAPRLPAPHVMFVIGSVCTVLVCKFSSPLRSASPSYRLLSHCLPYQSCKSAILPHQGCQGGA